MQKTIFLHYSLLKIKCQTKEIAHNFLLFQRTQAHISATRSGGLQCHIQVIRCPLLTSMGTPTQMSHTQVEVTQHRVNDFVCSFLFGLVY